MLLRNQVKRAYMSRFGRRRGLTVAEKVEWDLFPRSHFAYGLYQAAREAKALGLSKISAIELGVAGGNGLIAMENTAAEIGSDSDIAIEVYGFDTGRGQPAPHIGKKGSFAWTGMRSVGDCRAPSL